MLDSASLEKDPENVTFSGSLSKIFGPDEKLSSFQRRKYEPSIEVLLEKGIGENSALLDVGIGYGAFLWLLDEKGFNNTHGMDPFPMSIDIASRLTKAKLSMGRIEDSLWPFTPESFDCITSFDVIEHLEHPVVLLSKAYTYIRPGGFLLVTTPLKEFGYRMRNLPWLGIKDNNPTHINVHPPKYWLDLVENSRFSLVKFWRGEMLSHIRWMGKLDKILWKIGIDAKNLPILRSMEHSFLMLLQKQ